MHVLYTPFDAFRPQLSNAHQYALFAFQTQECRDETRGITVFLPKGAVVVKNFPQTSPKKVILSSFEHQKKFSKSRTDVFYTSFDVSRP